MDRFITKLTNVRTHMSQTSSTKCYIEEYEIEPGRLGARLREKTTGRKVDLGAASSEDHQHLLHFLSAAAMHKAAMPDAFTKDGEVDYVAVTGEVDFDAPDELRYIYNEQLSYLFA